MSATTHLSDYDVQRAVDPYDLGKVVDYELAGGGIENSNYLIRIRTPLDEMVRCVLTIIETPSHSDDEAYLALLQRCDKHGLPVPTVHQTYLGQHFAQVKGKRAFLSRYLPGAHVANPTRAQLQALGRFFARFHLGTADLAAGANAYPRNSEWLHSAAQTLASEGGLAHIGPDLQAVYDEGVRVSTAMLARTDVQALPSGYIHGDGFRDNVLFDANGLTGVIDFHHAAHGLWLFDLAVIANDWCVARSGHLDLELTLALLTSYDALRPLERAELWWFGAFAHYAATVFATSRLLAEQRASQDDATTRTKDSKEFLLRLKCLQNRTPLLDPRYFDVGRGAA